MPERGDLPFESIEDIIIMIRGDLRRSLAEEEGRLVDPLWRSDLPDQIHGSIAAIDGGSNRRRINQGQVVFITSSSLFERGSRVRRARKYQVGVLDDIWHGERISICRETMEVKMALRTIESSNPEILLLDGSLEALAGERLTPFGSRYRFLHTRRFLEDVVDEIREAGIGLTDGLVSLLLNPGNSEIVDGIIEEYYRSKLGEELRRDELVRIRMFLERYETLISLNELLSKSERLVAISKRSGSRVYFESRIPDLEIVRRSCPLKTGYLIPKKISLRFPEYYGIESSYPITITYAKFERNSNPLRIEVLGEHDEQSMGRILSSLARSAVRGYPYHLRVAHEMARIGRGEVLHLMKNLRLTDWISGREVLGEQDTW